jgi:hypothetical protein
MFRKIRLLERYMIEGTKKEAVERRKFCEACRAAKRNKNCATCNKETIRLVKKVEADG